MSNVASLVHALASAEGVTGRVAATGSLHARLSCAACLPAFSAIRVVGLCSDANAITLLLALRTGARTVDTGQPCAALLATLAAVLRIRNEIHATRRVAKIWRTLLGAAAFAVRADSTQRAVVAAAAAIVDVRGQGDAANRGARALALSAAAAGAGRASLAHATSVAASAAIAHAGARVHAIVAAIRRARWANTGAVRALLLGATRVATGAAVFMVVVGHADAVAHATVVNFGVAIVVYAVTAHLVLGEAPTTANQQGSVCTRQTPPVVGLRTIPVGGARRGADAARFA